LNDLQGIVASPHVPIDAGDLVRRCHLAHWTFTRVIASQAAFAPYHVRRDVSRFIDLSDGFEAYARDKHHSFAERLRRKARQMEREAGPVRFELHSAEPTALTQLMAWKSARYGSAGYDDVFAVPWARGLIERIHQTRTGRFAGLLSVLWAGDEMAAAHLGIRCLDRCHSWIVSYSPRFARYSPGLLLYSKLAESAAGMGVTRIEIGGGDYAYKRMLSNAAMAVAGGSVDRIPLVTAARRWNEQSKDWIRASSRLRPPARMILRAYRRMIRPAVK
jgi:CelD/BcsL family acetyltransferase involved in cellulose biosynthesis